MNQFGKILGFELKYYFKNKIFVGVTVALALLIAAVMFFPRISDAIQSGEEEGEGEEKPIMLVHTEAAEDAETVQTAFAAAFPGYDVQSTDKSAAEIQDQITAGKAECAFVITSPTAYSYYINTLSMNDTNT